VEAPTSLRITLMYAATEHHPQLVELSVRQLGVVHRRQLRDCGVSRSYLIAQLDARRWSAVGDNVVLLQNAPPTRSQLIWLAVLDAPPPAAIGSHTALELLGFEPLASEAADIHLIVRRGSTPTPLAGVRIHESRRLREHDIVTGGGPARTRPARSAVDAGAWQPHARFACLMVTAVIQRRLASPSQLAQTLDDVGRVRHRAYMRLAVRDAANGAQTLGEQDLGRVCRRFRLAPPTRQVRRQDGSGRWRYLDAEWELPNGEIVVLEIDGAHHMQVEHWAADMRRERAIVISRRRVLRATNFEIRLDPGAIVRDLLALGVPTLDELSGSQHAIASVKSEDI
jgi:very-short-patch-repair endonuclease